MDIATLKVQDALGHPVTLAYSSDPEIAANQINAENIENHPKTSMSGREIAAEINNDEYDGLTVDQKTQIISLVSGNDIDPFGFAANVIKDAFGVPSATVTALAAARVSIVSQAIAVDLGFVSPGHFVEARK